MMGTNLLNCIQKGKVLKYVFVLFTYKPIQTYFFSGISVVTVEILNFPPISALLQQ